MFTNCNLKLKYLVFVIFFSESVGQNLQCELVKGNYSRFSLKVGQKPITFPFNVYNRSALRIIFTTDARFNISVRVYSTRSASNENIECGNRCSVVAQANGTTNSNAYAECCTTPDRLSDPLVMFNEITFTPCNTATEFSLEVNPKIAGFVYVTPAPQYFHIPTLNDTQWMALQTNKEENIRLEITEFEVGMDSEERPCENGYLQIHRNEDLLLNLSFNQNDNYNRSYSHTFSGPMVNISMSCVRYYVAVQSELKPPVTTLISKVELGRTLVKSQEKSEDQEEEKVQEDESANTYIYIGIALTVLLVLVIGFGLVFFFRYRKSNIKEDIEDQNVNTTTKIQPQNGASPKSPAEAYQFAENRPVINAGSQHRRMEKQTVLLNTKESSQELLDKRKLRLSQLADKYIDFNVCQDGTCTMVEENSSTITEIKKQPSTNSSATVDYSKVNEAVSKARCETVNLPSELDCNNQKQPRVGITHNYDEVPKESLQVPENLKSPILNNAPGIIFSGVSKARCETVNLPSELDCNNQKQPRVGITHNYDEVPKESLQVPENLKSPILNNAPGIIFSGKSARSIDSYKTKDTPTASANASSFLKEDSQDHSASLSSHIYVSPNNTSTESLEKFYAKPTPALGVNFNATSLPELSYISVKSKRTSNSKPKTSGKSISPLVSSEQFHRNLKESSPGNSSLSLAGYQSINGYISPRPSAPNIFVQSAYTSIDEAEMMEKRLKKAKLGSTDSLDNGFQNKISATSAFPHMYDSPRPSPASSLVNLNVAAMEMYSSPRSSSVNLSDYEQEAKNVASNGDSIEKYSKVKL